MEELHRRHKDVPFGWVLWLQQAIVAVRNGPRRRGWNHVAQARREASAAR